jgi:hypothetical protein
MKINTHTHIRTTIVNMSESDVLIVSHESLHCGHISERGAAEEHGHLHN